MLVAADGRADRVGDGILVCDPKYDVALATYAWEQMGHPFRVWEKCRSFGVIRDGRLIAVIVFSEFRWPNIEASIWSSSPRWATPGVLRAVMNYAFHQLNCRRITAVTEATNQRARAFLCRLGFDQEGVHPDALPSGDAVTYGLLKSRAARWLTEDTCGQEHR